MNTLLTYGVSLALACGRGFGWGAMLPRRRRTHADRLAAKREALDDSGRVRIYLAQQKRLRRRIRNGWAPISPDDQPTEESIPHAERSL